MKNTELREAVIHHDLQLTALTGRINDVEHKIDNMGGKIDKLVDLIGQKPTINFANILTHIRDGAVILGLTVSAIIYVASGHSSAEMATIKEKERRLESVYERTVSRMDHLEKRLFTMEYGLSHKNTP